jgi:hypothetical protein
MFVVVSREQWREIGKGVSDFLPCLSLLHIDKVREGRERNGRM